MPELIVRVEAVNFSATIDDTNDLSTVRGGGLAALHVDEAVAAALKDAGTAPPVRLYRGASQCAFRIATADPEAQARPRIERRVRDVLARADGRGAEPPDDVPHAMMMHVVSVAAVAAAAGAGGAAKGKAEKDGLTIAAARGHAQQYRRWTALPIAFDATAEDADPLDGIRPATEPAWFPKDRINDPDDDGRGAGEKKRLSPAVKARRIYGRRARQEFYRGELGDDALPAALAGDKPRLRFAQSFQDIVDDPPPEAGLSVRGKIAVVYADGNKFGDARRKAGTEKFSKQLDPQRKALLKTIMGWLAAGAGDRTWGDLFKVHGTVDGKPAEGLRFETILWGGDELAFVMPAWLAADFVAGFFRHTADWGVVLDTRERVPLTHAVGVAVGHVKVPIRQLRAIAKAAADAAKDAGLRDRNTATFEIFESLHPPDTGLDGWRKSVFGAHADDQKLATGLALPGDGDRFAAALRRIDALRHGTFDPQGRRDQEPFPRSQIYAALRSLREKGKGVGEPGADEIVKDVIGDYAGRAGADRGLSLGTLDLPEIARDLTEIARLPARGPALTLALLTTLWDYAVPFGDKFPRFADYPGGAA